MADHPQTKSNRNPVPLDYDPLNAGDPSGLCQGSLLDYVTCVRDAARNSEAGRDIYQTALGFADAAGGTVRAVSGLTGAVVASTAGCPFQAGGCAGVWGRDAAAVQTVSAEAGYAWQHPAEAAAIISAGVVRSLARTVTKAEAEGAGYHALGALIFDVATAGVGAEPGLARDATELAAVPEGATLGTQAAEATSRVAVGVGETSTEGALGSAAAASAEADGAARAASATSASASTAAEPALGTGDLARRVSTSASTEAKPALGTGDVASRAADTASPRTPLSDRAAGLCNACFAAGTAVALAQGTRAIEALRVGDSVLAEDPATGKVEAEPVQAVIDDGVKPLMAVSLADGSVVRVTTNHAFWVESGSELARPGWLLAGDLRVGDRLRTADGTGATVAGLRYGVGTARVYTLTVATDHTFFVGTAQVLVHNCDRRGSAAWPRDTPTKGFSDSRNESLFFSSEAEARAFAGRFVARGRLDGASFGDEFKWRSGDGRWQLRASPSDVSEPYVERGMFTAALAYRLDRLGPVFQDVSGDYAQSVIRNIHLRWPDGEQR